MNRLIMILLWVTFGGWTTATIRVATSPDADLTPIALAITAVFGALALWATFRYERGSARERLLSKGEEE